MITPNRELNLRQRHPDYQSFLDINESESTRVRNDYNNILNQPYGAAPLQTLDIFPSKVSNSPILIFIHGGYWRALDKKSYSFIAEPFVQNNFTVCIINYRLIPSVNMELLLKDVQMAIDWIQKEVTQYNGDPNALVLSGHSAGGHLALMSYLMNDYLQSSIKAICSLSGIFDLAPIKNSYLNEVLQLTADDVSKFSASNKDFSLLKCPTLLSVGLNETDFFIDESKHLYEVHQSKASLEYYGYPHLNHYQIVHKLGQKNNPLVDFLPTIWFTKITT